MISVATLLLLAQAVTPDQMGATVAARIAALDRLQLEVMSAVYRLPLGADPLDRAAWTRIEPAPEVTGIRHRVTVVRPNTLHEVLGPDGSVASRAAVQGGGVTVQMAAGARTAYLVFPTTLRACHEEALLQVLDVHLADNAAMPTNLARVFCDLPVTYVGRRGDGYGYTAVANFATWTQQCEMELNERGTPLHVRTTMRPIVSGPTWSYEQITLAMAEVNGAQFPMESLVIGEIQPGNSPADHRVLQHLVVTSVEHRPDLTLADASIEPQLRNSIIVTRWPELDRAEQIEYDAHGNPVVASNTPTPTDHADPTASPRWASTLQAGAAAALGACLLTLALRRRSAAGRTARQD